MFTQKFCHDLLILMLFQTIYLFLLYFVFYRIKAVQVWNEIK